MNPDKGDCAAPQPFQSVERALLLSKNVNDHVIEIHQEPSGVRVALRAQHGLACLPQPFVHGLAYRLPLPARFNRHQNKRVRVSAQPADVKQEDVARLPVLRNLHGLPGEGDAIERCPIDILCMSMIRHSAILRHDARGNNAGGAP